MTRTFTARLFALAMGVYALASPASAFTLQPERNGTSTSPVLQIQYLGKGNTPEQEVQRILRPHLFLGSFIGRSVREAAGANAVLRDERVTGELGVCSFVTYRGGKAIVCHRI